MGFMTYTEARALLLSRVHSVEPELVPLEESFGRILAQGLIAQENVPAFDRSPYDGYAFRAEDIAGATQDAPVTLRITEEIPAGCVATQPVTPGTAAKILTGAPIPAGADTVLNFELTEFTAESVSFFAPVRRGSNIVRTGEDVQKGTVLVRRGAVIDPGTAGTLAAQGVTRPCVFRKPRIAILSTGSELVEADAAPGPGKIRNTNAHTLSAVLCKLGAQPVYLGIAPDSVSGIAAMLEQGLATCDAVIATGGVSVGDYDLTPDAMEQVGAEILLRGVAIKPGMACAYAVRGEKLICGLSGNPASSLTNYYAVALPALRALCGYAEPLPQEVTVALSAPFPKRSGAERLLRGTLTLTDGTARMILPPDQGNVVISSSIGCDVVAVVPAGSGPLEAGCKLKGFLV